MTNILRGKAQGMKAGKIREVLIPAGDLDREALDRLLAEDSVEKVVDSPLGRTVLPRHERGAFPGDHRSGRSSPWRTSSSSSTARDLVDEAGSGVRGGKIFLDWLRMEIDFRNIQDLFRLRQPKEEGDVLPLMIPRRKDPGGGACPAEWY